LPLNKRNLERLEKEDGACSMVSTGSNKTASGAIVKHCEPCNFKRVVNWSSHKKDIHAGFEVPSLKCIAPCSKCVGKYLAYRLSGKPIGENLSAERETYRLSGKPIGQNLSAERETYRLMRETYRLMRETYRLMRETYRLMRETYRLMRETYRLTGKPIGENLSVKT
jgi:hypothetical protein